MAKISTGLRNHLLATGSLKAALDGSVLRIYEGAIPSGADDGIGAAVLLCTISDNDTGTGLTMDGTPSGGVIGKDSTQVWSGTTAANGTASFYRFTTIADDGSASSTVKRVQGTVGTLLTDLRVDSTTFTIGGLRVLDSYQVGMPEF